MDTAVHVAGLMLLALGCAVGLASLVFGLPGTFVILGSAILYAWLTGFAAVTWATIGWLAGLSLVGEALQFFSGVVGSASERPSRRTMIWTLAGGVIGGVVGALVTIYLTLALLLTSFRVGLFALVPNVLPIAIYYGVLGLADVPLSLSTSLIGAITLGIAVDDTVHYFSRFAIEARLGELPRRLRGHVTGDLVLLRHTADSIAWGQLQSLGTALVTIYLTLAAMLTSFRIAMLDMFAACAGIGVESYVPRPKKGSAGAGGRFGKEEFEYDATSDSYRCPGGHTLSRETAWLKRGEPHLAYANPRPGRRA